MDRINLITLGVKDISVSVDFYRKLGLESIIMGDEDEMEIIFFRMKGSKLALYPLDTLATKTRTAIVGKSPMVLTGILMMTIC